MIVFVGFFIMGFAFGLIVHEFVFCRPYHGKDED